MPHELHHLRNFRNLSEIGLKLQRKICAVANINWNLGDSQLLCISYIPQLPRVLQQLFFHSHTID